MSTLKPNAPTPGPWTVGRERILELIESGELERVVVNREHAQGLLLRARRHLKTAHRLVVDDPEGAYTLLYDASRLAMTAALAVQGLRPTTRGGHIVVGDALRAQRGSHDAVGKLYSRLHRTRHEVEYPGLDYEPIAVEEAEEALEDAEYIVQEMTLFIPKLGPF